MSGGGNPLSGVGSGISGITNGAMGLIPGVSTEEQGQANYQQQTQDLIARIQSQWQLPAYQQTPLTPQEYTLLNQYAPQVAAFVQQQAPQLLSNIQGPGQQAQTEALQGLQGLATTGTSAADQAAYQSANISADQAMRSNRANAISLLNSRGLGNSGASLNADLSTGIAAAEQQRQASLQQAANSSQLKAQALSNLGSLGTNVAQQQIGEQEYNSNTLNQYNQLLANRLQQYQQYAADTQNQAQQFNQAQAQNISNQNVNTANQFATYNRTNQINEATNTAQSANQQLQTIAGIQSGSNAQALGAANALGQSETGTFMNLTGMGLVNHLAGGGVGPESDTAGAQGQSTTADSSNGQQAGSEDPNNPNGQGGGSGSSNSGALPAVASLMSAV